MLEQLLKFVTFGATPDQIKFFVASMWRVLLVTHIAWACNWLIVIGVSGFARADDVDKKVLAVTTPIQQQVAAQTALLTKLTNQLTDQLSTSTASEIRAQLAKRCLEKSAGERERINREIDKLQYQYKDYKGDWYRAPSCSEL